MIAARMFAQHRIASSLIAGVVVAAIASPASALSLAVTNPGFEDITGEAPFNEFTFGPLPGWGLHDPGLITGSAAGPVYFLGTLTPFIRDPVGNPGVYEFLPDGAPEGQRVGIAFSFVGSGGQGEWGFVQTLGDVLEPHTRYDLSALVGNIASGFSVSNDFFNLDGFPGYRIDLLAGGQVIASDNNSLASGGESIPEGVFERSTLTFVTGADDGSLPFGQPLGIRLVNLNVVDPTAPLADLEVDFDDVSLRARSAIEGDADRDGDVDFDDLGTLLGNYDTAVPAYTDFNDDGLTDFDDLGLLLGNYGFSGGIAVTGAAEAFAGGSVGSPVAVSFVVPEPHALGLLTPALLLLRRRAADGRQC